jgi:phage gpG-like protein
MTVDITPNSVVMGAAFGAVARGFRTFRQPLDQSVRSVGIPAIIENFEVGGRPPWVPHAETTVERRDRQGTLGGEPQDILIETGQLFGDATKLARWTITGQEAYISNLPSRSAYGRFHQTGADLARGGTLPQRPWASMESDDVDRIEEIFARWRDGIFLANMWRRVRRIF